MDEDDLRDVDVAIIDALAEGRNNAPNIAKQADYSAQYVRERFQFLKTHGVIRSIGSGIYELVDDPRGGGSDE